MKYFIDTHDKTKGSFPVGELTEEQFLAQFDELEKVAPNFDAFAHAAHVNLKEGKAFCFMCGADEESIRKAHEAVHLRYDSITEVKRVTGADMRLSRLASKAPQKRNQRSIPWVAFEIVLTEIPAINASLIRNMRSHFGVFIYSNNSSACIRLFP